MSEHALPEDFRRWPTDPYALLGVPQDVDETTVRRAYSRLIRRYKPEQSPEEFQKIRAAYEAVKQQLQWARDYPDDFDDVLPRPDETDGDVESQTVSVVIADPSADIHAAWQLARDGEWGVAHRRLTELQLRWPESEEIRHRRYWIETLHPQAVGIHGGRTDGPPPSVPPTDMLRSLFLTRMRRSPGVAYSPAAEAWWSAPLPPWIRMSFLRARWSGAARAEQFDRIEADLDKAREMSRDDRGLWYQALLLAVELSYMSGSYLGVSLRATAERWLLQQRDLELQFSPLLDRLDFIRDIAKLAVQAPRQPDGIAKRLALRGLIGDLADTEEWISILIASWHNAPVAALEFMETLRGAHPAFPMLIRNAMLSFAEERGLDDQRSDAGSIAARLREDPKLLSSLNWASLGLQPGHGGESRQLLLTFCLREGFRFRPVVESLRTIMALARISQGEMVCDTLAEDVAIEAVCEGCLAFWNV